MSYTVVGSSPGIYTRTVITSPGAFQNLEGLSNRLSDDTITQSLKVKVSQCAYIIG